MNLLRPNDFVASHPKIATPGSIRYQIHNANNNGLAHAGAIVRPPHTRTVFIDVDKYFSWLRGDNPGGER